jgi:response regulator RpfG family c-di-GMP phosphodiesterase
VAAPLESDMPNPFPRSLPHGEGLPPAEALVGSAVADALPPASRAFLDRFVTLKLLSPTAAGRFLDRSDPGPALETPEGLGKALVEAGLLTDYQLDRVRVGTTHGLVLGNYRVLERVGSGGMSCVFLAEHGLLKRRVAIKVLPIDEECPVALRSRFYEEMRVLADLHHPHVVLAYDAGELAAAGEALPALSYLVMEYVGGGDLEQVVLDRGPRPIGQACDWVRQAACGLQEAHDHHLIHRDVKPSNLLLGADGNVKVVDFGLARQFASQLTDPRALLGTVEFMSPEQSHDPSAVGAGADIYGLGATLFWLMTGEPPYPAVRSVGAALRTLQLDPPRRLRSLRPDAPEALEVLVDRMLARDPRQRPAMPLAVMNALEPFASGGARIETVRDAHEGLPAEPTARSCAGRRVLIVDDEPAVRRYSRLVLQPLGAICEEAGTAAEAFAAFERASFDLVLLDLGLPDLDGFDVCRRLREKPPSPNLKVIIVSGRGDQNGLAESLPRGADDYVPKPFEPRQLEAKVAHVLRLKQAQDRANTLAQQLMVTNHQLEMSLEARSADVRRAHDALLFGLAKMAESRDGETPGHLKRMQQYCNALATKVQGIPPWYGTVDSKFLEQLDRCVPLHDIGKIGLPDEVLLKPGALSPQERKLVDSHPLIGDRILETLAREHGSSLEFLGMARGIVRSHHERYDGCGYPDGLAGDVIPAAARIVAVADVYDALRRQRRHKPAMSHADAANLILRQSAGQFDPTLLTALSSVQAEFARIYRATGD